MSKPTDQQIDRPTYLSLDALLPKHKNIVIFMGFGSIKINLEVFFLLSQVSHVMSHFLGSMLPQSASFVQKNLCVSYIVGASTPPVKICVSVRWVTLWVRPPPLWKYVCPFVGVYCGCVRPFVGSLHAAYSALRHFFSKIWTFLRNRRNFYHLSKVSSNIENIGVKWIPISLYSCMKDPSIGSHNP